MSGKSSPRSTSRITRITSRVSSIFSRTSPSIVPGRPPTPSGQLPPFSEDDTTRPHVPIHLTENQLSPVPGPSASNASVGSAINPIQPSNLTQRSKDSADPDVLSTHLTPLSPLHPPHQTPAQAIDQGPTHLGTGLFTGAHNFSITGNNITFIDTSATLDNFMKDLLQQTIIGAEFDSSDRDPPPRCHPGTRLEIIRRCLDFIVQCHGQGKLRWVVGPAGVGKSAVMQIVAEDVPDGASLGASIFLSVNGRQDGTKIIITIAYQLAVKYEPYHRFIRDEISRDPSLLRKSLQVQFNRFIIEPFIHRHLFDPLRRFAVLIDGLDECDNILIQRELLRLISHLCITYPASPVVWIVASRPEPHIASFFEASEIASAYIKEEMEVDSNEACEDVQRYLREELKEIQLAYPTLKVKREWPSGHDFTKIATAAGGLFAYASTAVRYINVPYPRGPHSNLGDVLMAIDAGPKLGISGKNYPMAQLDALYDKIVSKIPPDAMIDIKKLLLLHWGVYWSEEPLRMQCNLLGLAEDDAYDALRHVHSTVRVPEPNQADSESFTYYHKSFEDYLKRAGPFEDIAGEAQKLASRNSLRVVGEVSDDADGETNGEDLQCYRYGYLKGSPGTCDNISLSWPGDERFETTDDELRLKMYRGAIAMIAFGFQVGMEDFLTMSFFDVLTTRFTAPGIAFPFYKMQASIFGKFRRELTEPGRLKRVPLRTLDYAAICGCVDLQFKSPIGTDSDVILSNPWNADCKHMNRELRGWNNWRGWVTTFGRFQEHLASSQEHVADIARFNVMAGHVYHWESFGGGIKCNFCLKRLARHLMNHPDELATVFVDSTGLSYVELSFVDPEDGMSEWAYRFLHSGLPTCIDV